MPDFRLDQNLRLSQKQKLVLTQKIKQALEILQLPSLDLDNLIRQELQENPLLEQSGDSAGGEETPSTSDSGETDDSWEEEPSRSDSEEDDTLDILKKLDEHSGSSYTGSYGDDEDSWTPEPRREPTMYEYLLSQVWPLMLPRELEKAVVYLVYSLDRHGLLSLPMFELQAGWEGDPELLEQALEIVRGLEPTGIGALSAAGALEMQLPAGLPDRFPGVQDSFEPFQ
ncbi:MAG: hypothetical protein GF388_00200 [Candidatus Aegiribacteria sp.]|nr:hypothetical protein [Candidatus Aegiribacteria sp.]MBD3293876.1 hypothetical protein [Candidatus Fermentibacteria bacterium]